MKVSAIVPLFNGKLFIERTLEAILAQSRPAHEIVVVDDGSLDGAADLVHRRYAGAVRLLQHGENRGVQAARNTGIAASSGDWLAFCDQDDQWGPDHLSKAREAVDKVPTADLIVANFRTVRHGVPDRRTKFESAPASWWSDIPAVDLGGHWRLDGDLLPQAISWSPFFPSACIMRRALIDQVGIFDPAMRGLRPEDGEFFLRCMVQATVVAIAAPQVLIHRHDRNYSADQLACLIDEVALLRFVRRHHRGLSPHAQVIDAEVHRRTRAAFDLAFAAGDHALCRRLHAELDPGLRTPKVRLKRLIAGLPDPVGRPLNALMQRLREGAQAPRGT